MWGVTDESSENPLAELWGLFKRDDDVSWQHKALCSQTDPEAFFPEKGGSTRDAKRVCAQCEVREQCQCLYFRKSMLKFSPIWGLQSQNR